MGFRRLQLLALLWMVGCRGPEAKVANAPVEPATQTVKIGLVAALTGEQAALDLPMQKGVMLAIQQLNAAAVSGPGRRYELVTFDSQSHAGRAAEGVKTLAGERVAVVIGESASHLSLAMGPVADRLRLPMISPNSTNPKVTEGHSYVFRICFTDSFQGFVMAKFAREELKLKRVGVLYADTEYSRGLADAFAEHFTRLGGKVSRSLGFAEGAKDFRRPLKKLAASRPEAIYLPVLSQVVGEVVRQGSEQGLHPRWLGGDGWTSYQLNQGAAMPPDNSYFSDHYSPQDPSPQTQRFVADYRAAYGESPDSNAALGFDAMRVAARALGQAKSLQGPEVRDAIAQTLGYEGVTGTISINASHNATKPAVVLRIDKGQSYFQTVVAPEPR